jgi:hypothetical protein
MLAWKQPPFKECVTAHWSSGSARKIQRGLSSAPKLRDSALAGSVGERRAASEAAAEASRGGCPSANAGMSSERGVRISSADCPRIPGEGSSAQG